MKGVSGAHNSVEEMVYLNSRSCEGKDTTDK